MARKPSGFFRESWDNWGYYKVRMVQICNRHKMATKSSTQCSTSTRPANEILTQILSHVGELSDALNPTSNGLPGKGSSTRNTSNANQTIEEEVRRVFGRSEQVERPPNTLSTAETNQIQTHSSGNNWKNAGYPRYNARKYFSNQRRSLISNNSKRGKKNVHGGPFTRDIILLAGPEEKDVPRQGNKVFLQESGHIINAFNFMREWSHIDVEIEIRNAFDDKIPKDVDIEILHSVHTSLHSPSLAPGQRLTGLLMSKVFGNNKPVYIRPGKKILFQPAEIARKRQKHDLPSGIFDDNTDDDNFPNWTTDVISSELFDQSRSKQALLCCQVHN